MDGSLAEQRQRDISPGNVESPRASERASERVRLRGKSREVPGGRMKGDEVEGLRGGSRWKRRHTLEVARRREGKGAVAVNRRGGARFSLGEVTRTSFSEPLRPVPLRPSLETPFTP